MPDLDLEAIKRTWLNQCGPCDYGMPECGCTHPQEDYRPVILSLVREVERLRADSEPPVNDIEATGECCCNGCIGEGLCDLDLGRRDGYPSADEYGWQDESGDLAYEGRW